MKRTTLIAAAVLAVVLGTTPAFAKTITYPGDYDDPNDAIDAAEPGDKVVIAADWAGPVSVEGRDGVTIQGKKKATITGVSDHPGIEIVDCEDVVVKGLRIRSVGHGVTIRGSVTCVLTDLDIAMVSEHGIAVGNSSRITIQKCRIGHAGRDGINLDTDLTGTAPDDCIVTKNTIDGVDDDGIDATGSGHTISKNRIESTGSKGINLDANISGPMTIEKNRITHTGEHGIHLQTADHTVSGNRVTDAGDDGIRVDGDRCIVTKNRVRITEDDGFDVEGDDAHLEKNSIQDTGGDGIDATGNGCTYLKNKVTRAGDDGIQIESDDNLVEKNTFLKCADHGLVVQKGDGDQGHRNVITKNKALKNLDDDMWTDWEDADDNTWDKNKYKTGNVPD
ncbi:MAG: right-handed parallel beta-helix repeat-containing protein [Planctomycetota bacterium]